jgi:AraC-like DNA-binding protein
MLPAVEYIAPATGRDWAFQVRSATAFDFSWHAHEDYELTVIREGRGRRLVGDHAAPYGPGDLALFGPRLPHTYTSLPGSGPQTAFVAHFRSTIIGRMAGGDEFRAVRVLLERSARGIAVTDPPASARHAIGRLTTLSGVRQTLALLEVLADLADLASPLTLASAASAKQVTASSAGTLNAVIGYLDANFARPVQREELAEVAAMSPSSVSRLLRRQLGTTLTDYLTSLRLAAACRALADTDRAIADIAHDCGFTNLANFNRQFKRSRQMTPRDYRKAFGG